MNVTDFDADELIEPPKVERRSRFLTTDRVLGASGIALACVAALFPWYVFFNEEQFGIRLAEWGPTRDLPEGPGRNVFSVSPLALVDNDDDEETSEAAPIVDQITTATVPNVGIERPEGLEAMPMQPFPGRSGFRLLHVANGRALIEDTSGMYMVRIGSILPDNSRVATLEQRDGKWVIVTSTGEVYANN